MTKIKCWKSVGEISEVITEQTVNNQSRESQITQILVDSFSTFCAQLVCLFYRSSVRCLRLCCISSSWLRLHGCFWKAYSCTSCWWKCSRASTRAPSTSISLDTECLLLQWLCLLPWTIAAMEPKECMYMADTIGNVMRFFFFLHFHHYCPRKNKHAPCVDSMCH